MVMNTLDMLLSSDAPAPAPVAPVKKKRVLFPCIRITDRALFKAYIYARLACEFYGRPTECYGYLIAPKGVNSLTVTDVFFAPDQDNTFGHTEIKGSAVIESGKIIDEMGYRVLGWWHSHATFGTFHSPEDKGNMLKILNAIAQVNNRRISREFRIVPGACKCRRRGDVIEMYDTQNPRRKIMVDAPDTGASDAALMNLSNFRVRMPVTVGFAYSLVVNAIGNRPYCEIISKEFCGLCSKGTPVVRENARLVVVRSSKVRIDKDAMRQDVESKLKKPEPEPELESLQGFEEFDPRKTYAVQVINGQHVLCEIPQQNHDDPLASDGSRVGF